MAKEFGLIKRRRNDSLIKVGIIASLSVLFVSSAMLVVILNLSESSEANANRVVVEKSSTIEMANVLVPVQSIDTGTALEPAMFRIETRPKIAVANNIVQDFELIQNKYARSLIVANQPLHQDYLTDQRPVNQITALIPEGYRAVTINVDVRTGIEGWARPGAKVDVVWSTTIRGKPGVSVIVENAKVISAARSIEGAPHASGQDAPIPSELTLLVPIKDANKIILAQRSGTLSLSLRGDSSSGKSEAGGAITIDDLISGANPVKQERPENIIKIKDANGQSEEFVLKNGKLVPLELLTMSNLAAE